jgi:hypothetical protein
MTMCDAQLGVIYQCDKNGQLMFAFGGLGPQLGLFSRPAAIINVGDELWVLDAGKRNITIFGLTEFGRSVHRAMKLYNDGLYRENVGVWESVIKNNANYLTAYEGLGKAYYQIEDYRESMRYFRLAGDRRGYSDAFAEQSLNFMRANFGWFFLTFLLIVFILVFKNKIFKRKTEKIIKNNTFSRFLNEVKFCLFCAKNPPAGYDAVKWDGKGSVAAGFAVVGLFFLVSVLNAQLTGFIFNRNNPDLFSILSVLAVTAGGLGVVFAAHYAVSSLLPSEAALKQLFITLSYPLAPYIICQFAILILSNFVSSEMGVFLGFINIIGIGWALAALVMGMVQTHRLGFGLVVANLAATAFGSAVIVFFMLLLYSLFQQLYTFFYTIFNEIMFRF